MTESDEEFIHDQEASYKYNCRRYPIHEAETSALIPPSPNGMTTAFKSRIKRQREMECLSTKSRSPAYRSELPMRKSCTCLDNLLKDLATRKKHLLLDSISSFLDMYVFHIPCDGYRTIPRIMNNIRRRSVSEFVPLKSVQGKLVCQANTHILNDMKRQYNHLDHIQKIRYAGQKKDVNSIKFYFMLQKEHCRRACDELCVEKPGRSLITHTIVEAMKETCRKLYESKYKILKLWVGRQLPKTSGPGFDTVVVVIEENTQRKEHSSLWGFHVLVVPGNECNTEANALFQYELQDPTEATVNPVNKTELSDLFNNHSNISLINLSNVKSKGFGTSSFRVTKIPTIVIYCHVKGVVPIGERMFPEKVSGFQVDVREGTCSLAVRELCMSENICADNCAKFGTLGGFVDLHNPPGKAFLTCAHVVLPTNVLQNQLASEYVRRREIIRVFDREKNEIGKITKAVFDPRQPETVSVDVALVEITGRHPSDGYFSDVYSVNQLCEAGFSVQHVPHFSNGQIEKISTSNFRKQVIKVGASSGLTIGSLRMGRSCAHIMDECDVNIDGSFNIRLFGQLEVLPRIDPTQPSDSRQPFVSDGDSGALVFAIYNDNPMVLKCIGMVVARTSYGSCLMTPIDKVLDALDLPYNCFSKFSIPSNNQDSDSESLRSMITSITQQLTAMQSTMTTLTSKTESMATKSDVESLKEDLVKFNDRLTIAESKVRRGRESDETQD